ncbi:MAG: sialidase family protein, partial [Actinomycetes bacterium]
MPSKRVTLINGLVLSVSGVMSLINQKNELDCPKSRLSTYGLDLKMSKLKSLQTFLVITALVVLGVTFTPSAASAEPGPLNAPTQVDQNCGTAEIPAECSNSNIAGTNTTRRIAVTSDGTIFASFSSSEGIRIARSVDRGQSFGVSTLVSLDQAAGGAEIAVSSNDILYAAWATYSYSDGYSSTVAHFSRSLDRGAHWSAPISSAENDGWGSTIHLAVDGDHVYAITPDGATFWVSSDQGETYNII